MHLSPAPLYLIGRLEDWFFAALLLKYIFSIAVSKHLEDEQETMGVGGKAFIFLFTAAFMAPLYYMLFQYTF